MIIQEEDDREVIYQTERQPPFEPGLALPDWLPFDPPDPGEAPPLEQGGGPKHGANGAVGRLKKNSPARIHRLQYTSASWTVKLFLPGNNIPVATETDVSPKATISIKDIDADMIPDLVIGADHP